MDGTTPITREAWLLSLAEAMRPAFSERGYKLPEKLRVSAGWPSKKALAGASGNRAIGQCFNPACSKDGSTELFISPVLDEALRVADVLAHELAHAAVGTEAKHGPIFGKCAKALGLEGKPTATVAGEGFLEWAKPLVEKLGTYPHASLDVTVGQKKQGTRMIKCTCKACGYVARTTRKWLEDVGAPLCACNGEEMEVAS